VEIIIRYIRIPFILILLPGVLVAWELQPKSLEERVRDADIIVVASVGSTISQEESPIMGVGKVWSVTLRVTRVLKGVPPKTLPVTFAEVAVQDFPSFSPQKERIWLLKASPDKKVFNAPASYESILLLSEESRVTDLLKQTK
jgi:hypothetical protein